MPFVTEKAPEPRTDLCSISLWGQSLTTIYINLSQGSITLESVDNQSFNTLPDLIPKLTHYINTNQLEQTPVSWLLSPEDYQIFLIDSLPVEAEEFKNALQWRIRSLINYPIEECLMDYFSLPAKKSNTDNMIAVVTARKSTIAPMIDILKQCHANICSIHIPELALRNLSAQYEDDEKSTAFLYFTHQTVILNISKQKILYFTRRLSFPDQQTDQRKAYEQLSLEILRYFDYFQSQWRHPAPSRILVAADSMTSNEIANTMSEYMLQPVQAFQLKNILGDTNKINLVEEKYLLTMGNNLSG